MGRPRELTAQERADLIRQGYRPVEIWVPDLSNEAYRKEATRQVRAAVEADRQAGVEELVDENAAQDWDKL